MTDGLLPTMSELDSYVVLFTIGVISYCVLDMLHTKIKEGWLNEIKFTVLQWIQKFQ